MRPEVWQPPVEPSAAEQAVMKAVRRARLFVFLRQHRHELFDEAFQGWGQAEGTAIVAEQAGVPALAASSLKAALAWTGTTRPPPTWRWPRCWRI
jgi:hypothetical protein